jgi:peptidoglycan lytic transglycosylase
MVLISRVVNQVQGCLIKILSVPAHGMGRPFGLSITSLVVGSFCSTLRLFAPLFGRGLATKGWRLCAKRRGSGFVSGLAISLTFSMIVILTMAAGGFIYFYLDPRAQEREGMEAALHRDGKSPNPEEATAGDRQLAMSKEDFEKLPRAKLHEVNSDIALPAIHKGDKAEMSSSLLGEMSTRFPDLRSSKLELVDKTLFCHNDNHNQTCQAPGAMDGDCRTMVSGLEERLLEKRLLARLKTPTIVNLRRAPPLCAQKLPFFDTPDARHVFLDEAPDRPLPNLPAPMGSQRIGRNGAPTCAWVIGTASTYNPSRSRHGSDDMQTASGELYDQTAWTAAIQIDLRELFGGVRYGKNYQPTFALVESGKKRLIVRINDVGPLRSGRAIDLNERSMRYFDPSLQLGLISEVKITPLPGKDWTPGPISDEQLIKLATAQ